MSFNVGSPRRRLSKDEKDLLKFVDNMNQEESVPDYVEQEQEKEEDFLKFVKTLSVEEGGPKPNIQNEGDENEEEGDDDDDNDDEDDEEEEAGDITPPPPPPQEMKASVGDIASQLDEDWEVMSQNPVAPSPEPPTSPKLDFNAVMKQAELARRSSYSERNHADELVHSMRDTLHYEADDTNEPPSAMKRAMVSRKFDHDSPNFIGLKCWADRWMVVDNDELHYFLRQSDEEEGKDPISRHKLIGCTAVLGTGPDVPKIGEYGDENYMPAVASNGMDKNMFKVITQDGPITHRCAVESEAAVWTRLFNYSPALMSPTLKQTKKIRASFSQKQSALDLEELRRLAAEEEEAVAKSQSNQETEETPAAEE